MNFFKNIYEVYIRELMKIIKDINLISIFIIAPITYPLLYGAVYMNKVEVDVPIAYQDDDNSSLSRDLLRSIDAHQNMKLAYRIYDDSQVEHDLMYEKVKAVVKIPKDFSYDIKRGKRTNVNLIAPAGRLLVIGDIGTPLSAIVSTFGAKISASHLAKRGMPVFENKAILQPIKTDYQYLHNPYLTYGDLVLPGLMAVIISQLLIIGAAASTAKEYGLDKWHNLFGVSTNYVAIIIGKLMSYLSIFFFFSLFILAIVTPLYHIQLSLNLGEMIIPGLLGMAASALFGVFLGTYFRHRITVFVVLGFSTYPFFMLSGFAWPWAQIPEFMQYVANCLPATPFCQSLMSITQMGNTFADVHPQVIHSVIQILIYSVLIIYRMNKLKRNPEPKNALRRYIAALPR